MQDSQLYYCNEKLLKTNTKDIENLVLDCNSNIYNLVLNFRKEFMAKL